MYSVNDTLAGGLPHSDIHGSTPARGSPWLFAACHVLHRLLVPRHPPNALLILDSPDTSPKGYASPCTETILRSQHRFLPMSLSGRSWKSLCFPQHNTIVPDGQPIDHSHDQPEIHPIQSFIAPLNPRRPTVGGIIRNLNAKHSSEQTTLPGQTSQPNNGTRHQSKDRS